MRCAQLSFLKARNITSVCMCIFRGTRMALNRVECCHIACFFCFWPVFQFNHFPSTVRAFVDISCVRKYLDNLEVSNTSLGILLLGTWYLQKSLLPHNGRDQIFLNRFCPWKWGSYPQILSLKKIKYFFFRPRTFILVTLNSLVTLVTKDFLASSFDHLPNTKRTKCFKGILPNQDQLFPGTSLFISRHKFNYFQAHV